MTALTAEAWNRFWGNLAIFLLWKFRWSKASARRDQEICYWVVMVISWLPIYLTFLVYRFIGRFGMSWAPFIKARLKDFDWIEDMDG